ncbi:hypothetical protein EON65_18350 [archaeon]|nr:MAG: hypothetical protein EON65_18350 [archaeon]
MLSLTLLVVSCAGMVLDSSFSSLLTLAEEMVDKGRQQGREIRWLYTYTHTNIQTHGHTHTHTHTHIHTCILLHAPGLFAPSLLVSIAIKFVRGSVQSKAGFDIRTLAPIDTVDRCYIPALFIAAEGDNFVAPSHTASLYAKYGGDKNVVYVEGDHNSARPKYVYDSISIFLQSVLQIPYEHVLHSGSAYVRRAPWTYTQPSSTQIYGSMAEMSLDEMVALQLMVSKGVMRQIIYTIHHTASYTIFHTPYIIHPAPYTLHHTLTRRNMARKRC